MDHPQKNDRDHWPTWHPILFKEHQPSVQPKDACDAHEEHWASEPSFGTAEPLGRNTITHWLLGVKGFKTLLLPLLRPLHGTRTTQPMRERGTRKIGREKERGKTPGWTKTETETKRYISLGHFFSFSPQLQKVFLLVIRKFLWWKDHCHFSGEREKDSHIRWAEKRERERERRRERRRSSSSNKFAQKSMSANRTG